MDPCHVRPFILPGVVVPPAGDADDGALHQAVYEPEAACDYCGSPSLAWRKCKLICGSCNQINKSCADL